MSDSANSNLAALNNALTALTTLQVAIGLVCDHLRKLQRETRQWDWELKFNLKDEFIGVSRKGTNGEIGQWYSLIFMAA